jgi:hypothetical protein
MSKISREKKRAKLERKAQAAEIAAAFLGKRHPALEKARTEMAVLDARLARKRYCSASRRPGEFDKAISVMCQLIDREAAVEAFLGLFRLAPSREHAVAIAKRLRGASMADAIFHHLADHWTDRRSHADGGTCSCDLCVPEIRHALETEWRRGLRERTKRWLWLTDTGL